MMCDRCTQKGSPDDMVIRSEDFVCKGCAELEDIKVLRADLATTKRELAELEKALVRSEASDTMRFNLVMERGTQLTALEVELVEVKGERDKANHHIDTLAEAFNGIKPPENYPFANDVYDMKALAAERLEVIELVEWCGCDAGGKCLLCCAQQENGHYDGCPFLISAKP